MDRVELVAYSDAIRDAYLRLLPEQEQEVAKGKLEWKFSRNPSSEGIIAVARKDEEVIGVNAFMPSRFKYFDRRLIAYQSMDTIVSPSARGQGVFGKLINAFYRESDASILYGFPNRNSSPGFFGKLGWKPFGPMPLLIRPLRTGYFLRRAARFLPNVRVPLLKRRSRDVERLDRLGDSATQAWTRFSAGIGCAVERDADFLNWRLCGHPTERYTLLGGAQGAFAAYTVAQKHGGRIGYLMEAIGENRAIRPLITTALHEMRDQGADAALACCLPWSPNYRAYRKAGFYPFPARLRPILINLGARALKEDSAGAEEARNWYVSYLDSDTA
jgi:GNAT superfamily N-acetyltransferase